MISIYVMTAIQELLRLFLFIFLMCILYGAHRNKHKIKKAPKWRLDCLDLKLNFNIKQLLAAVLLASATFYITFQIIPTDITKESIPPWFLVIIFLSMVIFGPIAEEMAFRMCILGYIVKRHIGIKLYAGFIIQLLIFTAYHFIGGSIGIKEFTYRFVGGFVYSALFVLYKRNLFPSIMAHSVWNIISLVLLF